MGVQEDSELFNGIGIRPAEYNCRVCNYLLWNSLMRSSICILYYKYEKVIKLTVLKTLYKKNFLVDIVQIKFQTCLTHKSFYSA